MKRTHSWNKGALLLSRFAGALLLAAFAVSCKQNVDTPKTETFPVTFSTNAKEYGTLTATLDDRPFTGGNIAAGKTATFTAQANAGYEVERWTVNGTAVVNNTTASYSHKVTAKTDVKVFFKAAGNTKYTVRHLQEGVDGTYTKGEEEPKTGTTGKNTEATAKTYTGFITPTVDQKPIAADGSTVIEIKYARKEITLTFELAGGAIDGKSDPVSRKGKYGAEVTKPAKPKKDGYTFSGWNPELPETFPAEDVTYTVQWAREGDYTITYNLNDGTDNGGNPVSYNVETATITLKPAGRKGYDFIGWYEKADFSSSPVTQIVKGSTGNKVFWAKWEPKTDTKYTVRHFKEKVTGGYDGVQAEIETLAGTTGKNTEATAKTYTGFITPTVDQKPIAADGSTVIEIKYARKEITFTFNLAGGTIDGKTDSVTVKGKYEATVTKPANPKKDGYTFSGWNPELPETFPEEDATYTAQWAKEGDYTITYNLNDGTNDSGNPQSYNVETPTIELKKASRTGYTFKGWYSNEACTGTSVEKIEKGSTGNKVFWAKWEPKTDTKYTVRHLQEGLDGKYGEVEADRQTLKGTTGNNTEATAKTYTGFITPTVDQEPIKGDGSTVITIKYARKEITLTFNLAGGTIDGKTDSVTVKGKYEAEVKDLPEPSKLKKTGYTFSSWNPELPETFPAEDATYTAQWTKLHSVTFTIEGTPPNGTLTATLDGKPFTGGNVAEGKIVEFTAKQADDYIVGKWHVTGSSFIVGTGLDGSTTARVKITAKTYVTVSFVPLPGKYISVPFGENGKNLDNYLKTANAASDGIYYIDVTDLAASDLKGVSWDDPSLLGKVLKANELKKVALKLGAITGLTNMRYCFSGCKSLVQAPEIPEGVKDMRRCFAYCASLTQAPEIPSSVTEMGSCFEGCKSLTQAPEIPSSVKDMGGCFKGCTSLTQAPVIHGGVKDMGDCFKGCTSLTQVPAIPNSVTNMEECFNGCTSLTQAPAIPNSVTNMGGCFNGCTSLTQAPAIPNSVTNMGGCFNGCTSLTQAPAIPDCVKDMGGCFSRCTSLTQAPVIPNGVTNMKECFSYCTSLTQASAIPNGVTDMGNCFEGCTSLTQAPVIPSSVTDIHLCFYNCTKLTSVTLECNYPPNTMYMNYFRNAFMYCRNLSENSIKVPADQLQTYKDNAYEMGTTANRFTADN